MIVFFFYQLDAQILYFNTFIILRYMFRALLCSSSEGQMYYYSIWFVTLSSSRNLWSDLKRVTIPDAVIIQLSS